MLQTGPMSVVLVPITSERFPFWRERCRSEYESDLVAAGGTREAAHKIASDALERAFPGNAPTADNAVFDLVDDDDGETVGHIWVGQDNTSDSTSWWVWHIVVDSEHRGKGFGRAAMQLAEDHARSEGACILGLNVFGFNEVARGLYESLGYETTSVKMRKML